MVTEIRGAKPIVKWAGGKRQLLKQFEKLYPEALKAGKITRYVEPFVGGGAVFFQLASRYNFQEIVLNDLNEELMLTYRVIKEKVQELIGFLKRFEEEFLALDLEERKKYYYQIRSLFNLGKKEIDYSQLNLDTIRHASYFIFLNRTCYNGLYRLNKKGEFNVPVGRYKKPRICAEKTLRLANKLLQQAILLTGDFEGTEEFVREKTFVYLDPPYRPLPGTKSFTNYAQAAFNEESQIRLCRWFKKLNNLPGKPYLMLSNSNPQNTDPEDDFFLRNYQGFNIDEVYAKRIINSQATQRQEITELVIRNYQN